MSDNAGQKKEFKRRWKTINNFKNTVDDTYEVSNDGKVRDKITKKEKHQKIASKLSHPYYAVSLKQLNGEMAWVLVHQLVGTFFVKVPKKYKGVKNLVIDHMDNNGLNNNYKNLQWLTIGENSKRSHNDGDIMTREHKSIPTTESLIHTFCELLEQRKSYKEILEMTGFDYTFNNAKYLSAIKTGKIHTDISAAYNIIPYPNPTAKQQVITTNLKLIIQLAKAGKGYRDIVNEIWPGLSKQMRKSRYKTVREILSGKKYKDLVKELWLPETPLIAGNT